MIKILVPGRPVPYVRTTQKAKYTQKSYHRYADYKKFVQIHAMNQYKGPLIEGYCKVSINVYLTGKTVPMGNDGDLDNYVKGILDSLNKIIFKDDRQVVSIIANKRPDTNERVEIQIEELSLNQTVDEAIAHNNRLLKKITKEQQQLFVVREENRNKDQISIEELNL